MHLAANIEFPNARMVAVEHLTPKVRWPSDWPTLRDLIDDVVSFGMRFPLLARRYLEHEWEAWESVKPKRAEYPRGRDIDGSLLVVEVGNQRLLAAEALGFYSVDVITFANPKDLQAFARELKARPDNNWERFKA